MTTSPAGASSGQGGHPSPLVSLGLHKAHLVPKIGPQQGSLQVGPLPAGRQPLQGANSPYLCLTMHLLSTLATAPSLGPQSCHT